MVRIFCVCWLIHARVFLDYPESCLHYRHDVRCDNGLGVRVMTSYASCNHAFSTVF